MDRTTPEAGGGRCIHQPAAEPYSRNLWRGRRGREGLIGGKSGGRGGGLLGMVGGSIGRWPWGGRLQRCGI